MKFLLFSGSLRSGSLNKKLLSVTDQILKKELQQQTEVIDLKQLSLPVYDGDIEAAGMPAAVSTLGKAIANCDAIVISSPEYNSSIAGSLKNTIDWISRLRPVPLEQKPVLLMGASPGQFGSIRALLFTRAPFETLGSYVYPQTFALPKAAEAFSDDGNLKDEITMAKLKKLLSNFSDFTEKLQK